MRSMLDWIMNIPGSTWAAWVQAIGSLAAIGVAIWISSRESRETKARAEAHYAELRRLAAKYAEDASAACKAAVEALSFEDMDKAREVQVAARDRVQDVADAVQGITPAILPEERVLVALTELRRKLAEAQTALRLITTQLASQDAAKAEALLPQIATAVADCAVRLRRHC